MSSSPSDTDWLRMMGRWMENRESKSEAEVDNTTQFVSSNYTYQCSTSTIWQYTDPDEAKKKECPLSYHFYLNLPKVTFPLSVSCLPPFWSANLCYTPLPPHDFTVLCIPFHQISPHSHPSPPPPICHCLLLFLPSVVVFLLSLIAAKINQQIMTDLTTHANTHILPMRFYQLLI